MTIIQVTLPEASSDFIAQQVASGEFDTPSEYLTFLVEKARAGTAKQRLDDLLEEGLASGPPIEFTPEWWRTRKRQLLATLAAERDE